MRASVMALWRRFRRVRRTWLLLPIDLVCILAGTTLSFQLRFYASRPLDYDVSLVVVNFVSIFVYISSFAIFRLYSRVWRHAGEQDLTAILISNLLATIFVKAICAVSPGVVLPTSVWLSATLMTMCSVSGTRLILRIRGQQSASSKRGSDRIGNATKTRVLIFGAGSAGSVVAKEMKRDDTKSWELVGYIDDNPEKHGLILQGVPIYGGRDAIDRIVARENIDQILIAIPSLPRTILREIVEDLEVYKIPILIVPPFTRWMVSNLFAQVRPVEVEDLLGRDPLPVDVASVGSYLNQSTVLVTGAGGSIGSEIVRQVAALQPEKIVLLGRGENSIFDIHQELRNMFPEQSIVCVIGDIRDRKKMANVFQMHRPDVLFHAAAHKHVPLMEAHPDEAFLNNVIATMNLTELSEVHGVKRFILISSDKAVRPTNVMGASKRIAEMVVQSRAMRNSPTRFMTVRFGNVLGSRGSVVRIFRNQIAKGGPVTITDDRMVRYFMTIPEAVRLVVEAGSVGETGDVFLFDMGDPVKIVDLAERMIRLSGFEPGADIPIEVTGIRPGEKLFEELSRDGTDKVTGIDHDRIWRLRCPVMPTDQFLDSIERLRILYGAEKLDELSREMKSLAWWEPQSVVMQREVSTAIESTTLPAEA